MIKIGDKSFLSGLDELVDPSRAALIMYDPLSWILRDYHSADSVENRTGEYWRQWARMLNGARQYHVPVIFTQHIYDWDVMTGAWLKYLAGTRTLDFLRGMPFVSVSDGTVKPDPEEFLPDLRPQPGESILLKMYHDSFSNTNLAEMLRTRNIETMVLTGMATESGVGGTARRAAAEGFYSV